MSDDVIAAVARTVKAEVERALDPARHRLGTDPTDHDGWVPFHPDGPREPQFAKPSFEAESWIHFGLSDVAVLLDSIWIAFRWTEPGTPAVDHLFRIPVPDLDTAPAASTALRCRTWLRVLLAPEDVIRVAPSNSTPGWRHRVTRTWLDPGSVVVSIPAFPEYPSASERQESLDHMWHPRPHT